MSLPDVTPRQSLALCVVFGVIGAGIGLAIAQRIRRREAFEEQLWRR